MRAFRAVDAGGYARVDFFLERPSGRLLVNEINTIPGFTSISMFPKLWEATGAALLRVCWRASSSWASSATRKRGRLRTDYRG